MPIWLNCEMKQHEPPFCYMIAKLLSRHIGEAVIATFFSSRDELNQLFVNRSVIGGFKTDYYWSSSEDSADHAWFESH